MTIKNFGNANFQTINISQATAHDAKDVWSWRNDALTKQMSLQNMDVAWEVHKSWYEETLLNPNRFMYLGAINSEDKVGMCRFDLDPVNKVALVSINMNPQYRGRHLSAHLLSAAMDVFLTDLRADLVATIKKVNVASIKCFVKCGFRLETEEGEHATYRYRATDLRSKL